MGIPVELLLILVVICFLNRRGLRANISDNSLNNNTDILNPALNQSSLPTEKPLTSTAAPIYGFLWEIPEPELDYWDWFEPPPEIEEEPPEVPGHWEGNEIMELEPQEIDLLI
ncbi:hypothetical protein HUJ04_004816 [Dendroctonus ponderosae]